MNQQPLISAICVTKNRPLLLQRAIASFEDQDYPNKEIVISYPEDDHATKSIINQIENLSDIKIIRIERSPIEKLGMSRNNAVSAANGAYVCIWDDDDWSYPNRISQQYDSIKDSPFKASVLMNVLMFDSKHQESYYSGYRDWEPTLFCEKKTLIKVGYLDLEKGEDASIIHYLSSGNILYRIIEMAHLYVYIYHGNNTWGEGHFNSYFIQSNLLPEETNAQIQKWISLDYYSLIEEMRT